MFTKPFRPLAAAAALAFLTGCGATVDIKSVASKDYRPEIKSLFILAQGVEKTQDLLNFTAVHVDSILVNEGFRSEVYVVDPLSLENGQDYKERIKRFKPDATLIISFKEGSTVNGGLARAVFDGLLVDSTLDHKIWRANMTMNISGSPSSMWKEYGRLLGNEMLRKMDEDGVIHLKRKIMPPEPPASRNPGSYQ